MTSECISAVRKCVLSTADQERVCLGVRSPDPGRRVNSRTGPLGMCRRTWDSAPSVVLCPFNLGSVRCALRSRLVNVILAKWQTAAERLAPKGLSLARAEGTLEGVTNGLKFSKPNYFRYNQPHLSPWHQAVARQASPHAVQLTANQLLTELRLVGR